MEEFPIWLKIVIYLIVGSTAVYAVAAIVWSIVG